MKFKVDIDWLLERMPEANENQIEAFQERVSIMTIDAGIDEEEARNKAIKIL